MRVMLAMAAGAMLLAGCETTYKQVPVLTAAEGLSAIRFAHGSALMMSDRPSGTVWLKPVRYSTGDKIFFEVVAFNHKNMPVNFGSEDVEMRTDDGASLRVHDFDRLQHQARKEAQAELAGAMVVEGLEAWHAERVSHRDPHRANRIWRNAQDQYFASQDAITEHLEDAIETYSEVTLQTTTVDPFTTFGGVVFADRAAIPGGGARDLLVNVRFAGEDHRFRLRVAAEGVPTPLQRGLPAVNREQIEAQRSACATWMWNRPDLACHHQGLEP